MASDAASGSLQPEADVVPVTFPITLGQFLKVSGLASTGGEAKHLVSSGLAQVNGEVDTRRGRKLAAGDLVAVGAERAVVSSENDPLHGESDSSGR